MNMVTALERDRSIASSALARIRRLGAAVLVVRIVSVLLMIAGHGTPGLLWFTLAGPLFAQNLTVGFFILLSRRAATSRTTLSPPRRRPREPAWARSRNHRQRAGAMK